MPYSLLNQLLAISVYVLPPVVLRVVLVHDLDRVWTPYDLRGACEDAAVGLGLCLFAALAGRLSRWISLAITMLWLGIIFANHEHIKLFDTAVEWRYAHYLLDPTFFAGSVAHAFTLAPALVTLSVGAVITWFALKPPLNKRTWIVCLAVDAAIVAACLLWPLSPNIMLWRQHNVVVSNVDLMIQELRMRFASEPDQLVHQRQQRLNRLFVADLNGTPRFERHQGPKPNILLLMLESVSGAYIPALTQHHQVTSSITMPKLDAWLQRGLRVSQFVNQQHQTNRGSYAILCGDYPKLDSSAPKMSEYANGRRRRCLPEALRDLGYHTAYLQAAPLGFMMKDSFMKQIGFAEAHGYEIFDHAYARSSWGPDDRAFFEQSAQEVIKRKGTKPWFITLLNSGTHHPYNLPSNLANNKHTAFKYLDSAVNDLLNTLQNTGILRDTLLIITSDESGGAALGSADADRLSHNWGVFGMVGKNMPRLQIDTPHSQNEIALSILDWLGHPYQGAKFTGRSIVRRYPQPQPIFFANTYLRRGYKLDTDHLMSCHESGFFCQRFAIDRAHAFTSLTSPPKAVEYDADIAFMVNRVAQWQVESEAPNAIRLVASEPMIVPNDDVFHTPFGDQRFRIEPNQVVEVKLDIALAGKDALLHTHQHLAYRHGQVGQQHVFLQSGDRLRFYGRQMLPQGAERFSVNFLLHRLLGDRPKLEVKEAWLRIHDHPSERLKRPNFTSVVDRAQPMREQRLAIPLTPEPASNGCIATYATDLIGHNCDRVVKLTAKPRYYPKDTRLALALSATKISASIDVELKLEAQKQSISLGQCKLTKTKPRCHVEHALMRAYDEGVVTLVIDRPGTFLLSEPRLQLVLPAALFTKRPTFDTSAKTANR